MSLPPSESYDEEKARERSQILKWLLKASVYLFLTGLVVYLIEGKVSLAGLVDIIIYVVVFRLIMKLLAKSG